jgi:hypothetical protein
VSPREALGSAARAVVRAGSALAAVLAVHTALNARLLRTPLAHPPPVAEAVSVLLPVRDEQAHVQGCLRAVLASTGVPDLQVLVLDDASTDATAALAAAVAREDPRVEVLTGAPLAPGWLGKPHALAQLAGRARGSVLVAVDADVRLAPHALAAAVDLLRRHDLDLVSPYPRQVAVGAGERLVQPLLQWSFLATLPLRLAERSARPSLSAANGQLMALDAGALRRAGGFAAVRNQVLDDVALVRAVKASGGRGGVADGTHLATCRMYTSWAELTAGYTKSLWSATGSPAGALAAASALGLAFVVPPVAAAAGSRAGLLGYLAGVAGRVVAARRTGGRVWPDALAHPASVAALGWLLARSWRGRRRGDLRWRGRPVGAAPTLTAAPEPTAPDHPAPDPTAPREAP